MRTSTPGAIRRTTKRYRTEEPSASQPGRPTRYWCPSQKTYGVIGGERERRSRAPVSIFVSHLCALVNHTDGAICSANCPCPTPCGVCPQHRSPLQDLARGVYGGGPGLGHGAPVSGPREAHPWSIVATPHPDNERLRATKKGPGLLCPGPRVRRLRSRARLGGLVRPTIVLCPKSCPSPRCSGCRPSEGGLGLPPDPRFRKLAQQPKPPRRAGSGTSAPSASPRSPTR